MSSEGTEDNTEQDSVLEKVKASAEAQKTVLETQKAAIEVQKAAVDAMKISSKLEPQEGKTETDKEFGYISQLVAYQVLKESSKKIGKDIASKLGSNSKAKILIMHDLDVASEDLTWLHVKSITKILSEKIKKRIEDNYKVKNKVMPGYKLVPAVLIAAMGAFSLVVDILGYFKTDYSIKGQKFALEEHAILANVCKEIGKITSVSVSIFKYNLLEKSSIIDEFEGLLGEKAALEKSLAELKTEVMKGLSADIDRVKEAIKKLEEDLKNASGKEKERITQKIGENRIILAEKNGFLVEVNACISATDILGAEIHNFIETVTKTPDDKSPPLLLKAILRQYIRDKEFTHLLNLKILSAGGEAVTMQKRIGPSGKLQFIGGCAISYILIKKDGTYVMADTHHGIAYYNYDLGKAKDSLNLAKLGTFDDPIKKEKKWYQR
jgi:hypothetical protein